MVEYTGVYTVNRTEATATPQIATAGLRNRGETCRTAAENGSPPSRAKAKAIRDAEVTVARPQRYWAITAPPHSPSASVVGTAPNSAAKNAPSPWAAVSAGSRIASTTADSITHPNTPDTSTERTIPRGTFSLARTVSSEAWAEASNPVIVYAGSRNPRVNTQSMHSLRNH